MEKGFLDDRHDGLNVPSRDKEINANRGNAHGKH